MTLPNPNHHWRFDEINGRQAIDAIGGATITLDNTSFRPGKTANALRLNLANGASVVSTSLADLPPPWTASMWIKREADSASMVLFSSDDFALKLEQFPSLHTVGITRYYTGAGNSFDDGSDYTAPLNEWVHLTFVGTGADTKVYADGELKHTFPRSISLPLKWIGSRNGDSEFGSFLLDDLKVFNQALTDDQVRELAGRTTTKIAFGRTAKGQGWVQGTDTRSHTISINVDTSSGRFSGTPVYVANVEAPSGSGGHRLWYVLGAGIISDPTATGFRIDLRWDSGTPDLPALTPALAAQEGWCVAWTAFEGSSPVEIRT